MIMVCNDNMVKLMETSFASAHNDNVTFIYFA